MSQHDYVISDADGASFLADLNSMSGAIVSLNSGSSAPSVMYAYMPWVDTSSGYFKQRNSANSGWITLFKLSTGGLAQLDGMDLTGAINDKRSTVAATATTTPLWAAGTGGVQDWTGTPTITDLPAAPQPGAKRTVYPAVGTIFTDNANIDVEGDQTYTVRSGDRIEIEALTTTTFKVWIKKKAGALNTFGGSFTRNMASASTTQVITGVGFRPKRVRFYMAFPTAGTNPHASVGEDNGTYATCVYDSNVLLAGTNAVDTANSIHAQGGSGKQEGKISAFSDDGFTISWVLTSTGPALTATISYFAEA
jgi:hypothetical protein